MESVIIATSISFILGILIVLINKVFKTRKNRKKEDILELLPGFNCGACGYGSCEGMAEALLEDEKAFTKCKPLKEENIPKLEKVLKD